MKSLVLVILALMLGVIIIIAIMGMKKGIGI